MDTLGGLSQVVELKSELRRLGAKGVHVGSVVTAQGSEPRGSKNSYRDAFHAPPWDARWDYVLLSTVLSNGSGLTEALMATPSGGDSLFLAPGRAEVGLPCGQVQT